MTRNRPSAPPKRPRPKANRPVKLGLDVRITDVGPCKKHLKVTIARSEIERQFDESFGNMKREAAVPGFRPGRAPRQLVEKRFRKQVAEQVKSSLLMASLEQLDEEYKLNLISEPHLDLAAIELPDEGPMLFEMDVEVRPEFSLPAYKALSVKLPVKTITDADVDAQTKTYLERYAQMVPKLEGGAEIGDFVTADIRFHRDEQVLNESKEVQFRLQPELRFQDGSVPNVGETLLGIRPGESREAAARIGSGSADSSLRGQAVQVTFQVNDLKQLRLPEVNTGFLASIGFETQDQLRQALRELLERRLATQQRQAIRKEVLDQFLAETPFDLPADLVARQERSTIRRMAMELRQGGLSDNEILRPRGRDPRQLRTSRPCGGSRNSSCSRRSPRPRTSRSRTRTSTSRSSRSRPAPTRARDASAPGSRRRGWARRWRRKSSNGRPSTASYNMSSSRRCRWSSSRRWRHWIRPPRP